MTRPVRIIALVVGLAGPAVALAQPASPRLASPDGDPMARAQTLINEAARAFAQKDFEGALNALLEAERLAARASDPALPKIRFNIARCLEELERWQEAMAAYERYNELPDESHRKQRAFEAMRSLKRRVYGRLSVVCAPTGSLVQIVGLTDGAVSCPWQSDAVPSGAYAVKISHPGYESIIETVDVRAGQAFNVEATLKSLLPPPAVAVAPSQPLNLWPLLTVGAGLVVAASGGYFTQAAVSDRDDLEALPPGPQRSALEDDFNFNRAFSYAMYGTGAALIVGGVVWWLLDDPDDPAGAALDVRARPDGLAVHF